jgi:hypothetical protein
MRQWVFIGCLWLFSSYAFADNSFGYALYGGQFKVDDPDGPTESTLAVFPLNVFYVNAITKKWRLYNEAFYYSVELDADDKNIGQDVTAYGIVSALQKQYKFSKTLQPWLGGGISWSRVEFNDRFTKDSDGFLLRDLEDRSDDSFSLAVLLTNQWDFTEFWDLGFNIKMDYPLNSDVTTYSIGITISHK